MAEHPINIFDGVALEQVVLQMYKVIACTLVGVQLSHRCKGEMCPILCAHRALGVMTVSDIGQFGVYPPAVVIMRAQATLLSACFITSLRGGQ